MRIRSGWALLALATRALVALADDILVEFDDKFASNERRIVEGQRSRMIALPQGTPSRPEHFSWTTNGTVKVKTINLLYFDKISNLEERLVGKDLNPQVTQTTGGIPFPRPTSNIPSTQPTGDNCRTGLNGVVFCNRNMRRTHPITVELTVNPVGTGGGGTATILDITKLLELHSFPIYFEAVLDGNRGSTFSPAFAVINETDPDPEWVNDFIRNEPFRSQGLPGVQPSLPTSPGATAVVEATSGGGLATGAIVGIAVGVAVVVLAIIGALIWFFLRRRQQERDEAALDPFGAGRSRTDELMAEKEANAGTDVSPSSPYSDDGGARGDSMSLHGTGAAAAGATAAGAVGHKKGDFTHSPHPSHSIPRSFTPYSDHQESTMHSPSTQAASITARDAASPGGLDAPSAPRPGTTQYAHLVEEGMTEEEIRRLEDEERQLDAAIAQAGKRS